MLERPDIDDAEMMACLRDAYGLRVERIAFLPIGNDVNTAVFRVVADDTAYFVKLRSGTFDEMTTIVPSLLHAQGSEEIIAPLTTRSNQLWATLGRFKVAVSPFVEGKDAYEIEMRDAHWIALGQALKALHTAVIPADVEARIQRETYTDKWREMVRQFQAMVEQRSFDDPVAAKLAAFLRDKHEIVDDLIHRAEKLARMLQAQAEPFVLCHADIHAGNVLIDAHGRLYVVDWDTLIMAPKERDLMYVGGGQFLDTRSPEEEARLFYQGYGETAANQIGLAYYRYERIVQDIAAYCEALLLTDEGGEDRENSLRQLTGQFGERGVIGVAYRADRNPARVYV